MSVAEQIQQDVGSLPPALQQQVLDFVHALQRKIADEDAAIGQTGAALTAQILTREDFSDWEKSG